MKLLSRLMALTFQWKASIGNLHPQILWTPCLKSACLPVSWFLPSWNQSPISTSTPKWKDHVKTNFSSQQILIFSLWDTAKALSGWYLPLCGKQQTQLCLNKSLTGYVGGIQGASILQWYHHNSAASPASTKGRYIWYISLALISVEDYFQCMFMDDQKSGLSLLLHDMVRISNRDVFSMDIKNVIFVHHHIKIYIMQILLIPQI